VVRASPPGASFKRAPAPPSPVTWAELFERAAAHDVDEAAIRERLGERRVAAASDDATEEGES